jgi:glycosyltransferase involved in cell wall biosynthesis
MRIVSTGYMATDSFTEPAAWLERIAFYTGILEALASEDEVHSIEHINASGSLASGGVSYHFRRLPTFTRLFPIAEHRFIKRLHPDAVLVNGFSTPLQVLQLRAAIGRRPQILLWHRADRPRKGWRGGLQRLADRCVDAYLFTAPGNAAPWIESGIIPEQKANYLMQGSSIFSPGDRAAARRALSLPEGPLFLWVGRLDANKDPLSVLKAFSQLRESRPGARLYMAGPGGPLEAEVRQLIDSDPLLRDAVTLVGEVPHRQLEAWYRAADFFVSASHYEGSGIALCEALSCGCIPVHSAIPSLTQLTGPIGYSFNPGDVQGLKGALEQALLSNSDQRAAVIERFQNYFSFDAIAGALRSMIASG